MIYHYRWCQHQKQGPAFALYLGKLSGTTFWLQSEWWEEVNRNRTAMVYIQPGIRHTRSEAVINGSQRLFQYNDNTQKTATCDMDAHNGSLAERVI